MDPSPPPSDSPDAERTRWRDFAGLIGTVPQARLGLIAALMAGAALSEGIGIALLVPLLELAGGDAAQSRPARVLAASGLPLSLGIVLSAFVVLVALRTALVFWLGSQRLALQLDFADGLRKRCYAALIHADWRWLSSQRSADHNAALVTNSTFAGVALDQALSLAATAITSLVLIAISFAVSWQVTLIALALGTITFAGVAPLLRRAMQIGHETNRANRELHRQVEQGIARFRETKILGAEAGTIARFDDIVTAIGERKRSHHSGTALGSALIQVSGAVLLAVLVYAGRTWAGLSLAVLLPLLLVFLRLTPLLQAAQQGWTQWLHALPAFHELQRMTAAAEARAEPRLPPGKRLSLDRAIVLTGVTVRHLGRQGAALEAIDLAIAARTTVAIVGPSGGGKSTLADLIGGLIAPDSGSVRIDDLALDGATQRRWRESVAYVQQSPLLHHGTIRENLTWAHPEASDAQLAAALSRASADFVLQLPQGLETAIGDAGLRLSGGERQRIAIARALLRDPQLLILDEVSSALDAENEAAVLEAVAAMRGRLTIAMIGHRPAMLALADRVIELRDGRLAASD
jgi:ATP-binding cassette subfamily C protein